MDQNKLTELFEVPSHPGVDVLLLTGRGKGIKFIACKKCLFGQETFFLFFFFSVRKRYFHNLYLTYFFGLKLDFLKT